MITLTVYWHYSVFRLAQTDRMRCLSFSYTIFGPVLWFRSCVKVQIFGPDLWFRSCVKVQIFGPVLWFRSCVKVQIFGSGAV